MAPAVGESAVRWRCPLGGSHLGYSRTRVKRRGIGVAASSHNSIDDRSDAVRTELGALCGIVHRWFCVVGITTVGAKILEPVSVPVTWIDAPTWRNSRPTSAPFRLTSFVFVDIPTV